MLVLPALAGPKTSTILPRGTPPHSKTPKSKVGRSVEMTGMGTTFLLPNLSKELVVSNFLSKDFPRANNVLNFSTSVVGATTTTLGTGCSSFFLLNAKACLFLSVDVQNL